ncbi:chaperone protein dnaJ 49 [Punica granatum]|uniref:Chaperone protein dnaJ 49 n=2 Tax=Punica granatum TaxID=22663 RepID=A0A6P8EP41_PUNGR|nr:chaperone protein dnaJ 49 [Punica granatum]XP_031407758.1 chaperone protein dnaJ 49 [Punica granatum]XP_031407770.1 chaperone protein dnaJ 49 [Punica granatum]OWM71235.1 hypothetical protein CDL15_Pgr011362 [Punica granatum]PKI65093.1 hypothetical protein CRG98_014562 [Punica granatum]
MDGNKDEALRCMRIAEQAIASGNKERALKFIRISHRLNPNLPVAGLLDACEKLGSAPPPSSFDEGSINTTENGHGSARSKESLNGERNYTEEHVQLIKQVRRNQDYYAILGVEKTCSVEEIRKAYRKLSLKVHPDKNKAPGSEEAFKKVSRAFKCLSDSDSRRQYDQTGLVEEFEPSVRHNVRRRRRRRTGHDLFEDDFDPDEIFRAFFGQGDLFRASHAYRTGQTASRPCRREEPDTAGFSFMVVLQILPFFIIFLLAYLPFTEPEYSLFKNYSYQIPKTTEQHGVEFFVKSSTFDARYSPGSAARANFEDNVIKDYKNMLRRYCHVEMQRRQWNKRLPTPNCNKLQNLGVA